MRLESFTHDVRDALRGFRRAPGTALIALLILACGIGANTAVFSIVNPLLLRPLPFPESDRLVWIASTGTSGLSGVTYRVDWYEQFRQHNRSFEDLAAYFAFFGYGSYTLTGGGDPERVPTVDVGPRFFETLGVQPALGRLFTQAEHRASGAAGLSPPSAALLTHGLWRRRFGGDPSVVGTAVTINNAPVTIVGVLPATFDFASVFTPGTRVDLFVPANLDTMRPWGNTLAIVGRLKPGVEVGEARAEFAALLPQLMEAHPDWGRIGARLTELKSYVSGRLRTPLLVLWAAVALVLLIVCANVANLLLARASARSREFAVRLALGAGRARLIRQLLVEGVLLALAGAALGVPLAFGLTRWLAGVETLDVPLLHYVRVDPTALAVTAAIACLTGIVFAVAPALRAAAERPQSILQEHGRGPVDSGRHVWLRRGLVVAGIALAAVLLIGAGLLARSFGALLDVELGFEPSRAMTARLDVPPDVPGQDRLALGRAVLRRIAALPGVERAAFTDALPLDHNRTWIVGVPDRVYAPAERPIAFIYVVSPGYLAAMGMRLVAGRDFVEEDPMKDRVPVIVNETLARALYPDQDPIGRPAVTNNQPITIVGVAADVRQGSLDERPVAQMYLDFARIAPIRTDLVVRAALAPAALGPSLRQALADVDPRLVATDIRVLETLVDRAVSPRRFLLSMMGGFSLLALLLASLGIYGVVSYGVAQRTPEIGVRMALGATAREVRRQVLRETLALALGGTVIGAGAALALTRIIAHLLYATSTFDPVTFGSVISVLLVVALVAGYIPALRASRIEPMQALR